MKTQTQIDLQQAFTGTIILPGDKAYDEARSILFRRGSPALIAMAETSDDVALALNYAKQHELVISVRSGGHSNAGLSTNDGGIIIDVSRMNTVEVIDHAAGRVRIGAGAHWGDIAKTLHASGLAISSGDTNTVGASGLMLGAGIGWMVRKYGLAIDSLVRAEVVTADGQLVVADATTNPDLFWAVRGGGGNFGVVVSLECIAHKVSDVFFGSITYTPDDPTALLTGWRDYMRSAPEDLTTTALLLPANMMGEHPAMFVITCCWANDQEAAANAALEPLRKLGIPLHDDIKRKAYYEALEDAHTLPDGVHSEVNNALFPDFSDAVIKKIVTAYSQHGRMSQIRGLGGAMSRVAADATAFAHRDAEVMVLMPIFMPAGTTEEEIQKILQPWREIATDATGAYINFFSRVTDRERAASYPPATYNRLAVIKGRYDPDNVFNQNLNIEPKH
ncbi:MAG TPA: FAD-binding oxidoreductase [Candidatus Saccharimonadales bacterium]|nr:FAD-binding oxidoreductase [Candidatus Saccharimonadales bacterium]